MQFRLEFCIVQQSEPRLIWQDFSMRTCGHFELCPPHFITAHSEVFPCTNDRHACHADGYQGDERFAVGSEKKRNQVVTMLANMEEEDCLPNNLDECWLDIVCPLLRKYDAALLCRHIPKLPTQSMQKIWDASAIDYGNHLADKVWQSQDHIVAVQVSKMAMSRILETTFARLALTDPDIHIVYVHWSKSRDKPNRKGKDCAKRYKEQWYWRRYLRCHGL